MRLDPDPGGARYRFRRRDLRRRNRGRARRTEEAGHERRWPTLGRRGSPEFRSPPRPRTGLDRYHQGPPMKPLCFLTTSFAAVSVAFRRSDGRPRPAAHLPAGERPGHLVRVEGARGFGRCRFARRDRRAPRDRTRKRHPEFLGCEQRVQPMVPHPRPAGCRLARAVRSAERLRHLARAHRRRARRRCRSRSAAPGSPPRSRAAHRAARNWTAPWQPSGSRTGSWTPSRAQPLI